MLATNGGLSVGGPRPVCRLFPANRVFVIEAGKPFEPRVRARVTDIDNEYGVAATVREELGIHPGASKPGIGPAARP